MPISKDNAISVSHVSKDFKLPHEKVSSLKGSLISGFKKKNYEMQHALKDISFEVKKGEFFGIVGRNGSGKSTLLKCIAGVYATNEGKIDIHGKLIPFIELGVGFNPELSGRDNVYLNGALLGFSRKQMSAMYDDIVEFSELENFMDQKLKNYSSGMQVRLAFSIAIRANGDILLLDEVLAVGDSAFQRKCLDYFHQVKKSDKTVILVTHSMAMVEQFCDRAMMIENSRILSIGSPLEIALQYEIANSPIGTDAVKKKLPRKPYVAIKNVNVRSQKGDTEKFSLRDELIVDVDIEVLKKDTIQINLGLFTFEGEFIAAINTKDDIPKFSPKPGRHHLSCRFDAGQITKGMYKLNVAVYTDNEKQPELIDIVSTEYGVHSPIITFTDISESRNGKFLARAEWSQRDK